MSRFRAASFSPVVLFVCVSGASGATYKSPNGYRLTLPPNFEVETKPGVEMIAYDNRSEANFSVTSVESDDAPPTALLLAKVRRNKAADLKKYREVASGPVSIGGARGIYIAGLYDSTRPYGVRRWFNYQAFVFRNGRTFVFTGTSSARNRTKASRVFRSVLASWRFTR